MFIYLRVAPGPHRRAMLQAPLTRLRKGQVWVGLEGKGASPSTGARLSAWALGEGAPGGNGWGFEFGGGRVLARW